MYVASEFAHHLGELGKSVMRGVEPRFQVATFALTSGYVQDCVANSNFSELSMPVMVHLHLFLLTGDMSDNVQSHERETCMQFSL